jgi:glycogen phosphorylase
MVRRMAKKPDPSFAAAEERNVRLGMSRADLKQAILDHLHFTQVRTRQLATPNDWYLALAHAPDPQGLGSSRRIETKALCPLP